MILEVHNYCEVIRPYKNGKCCRRKEGQKIHGKLNTQGLLPQIGGKGRTRGRKRDPLQSRRASRVVGRVEDLSVVGGNKKKSAGKTKKKNTVTGEIGNFVGGKKLAGNENRKSRGFIEGGVGEKKSGAKSAC